MEVAMSTQPRVAKVLMALLVSMTTGAIVLMALGNNPPSAGPFCLSSYYSLGGVRDSFTSKAPQYPARWNRVEVYYSGTKAGNIEQLASLCGLNDPQDINCHFVVCNGLGAGDGQIQKTEKWHRQWSAIPSDNWYGTGLTIRLCVVADEENAPPTDSQLKRTESLVQALSREFRINPGSVHYPQHWR